MATTTLIPLHTSKGKSVFAALSRSVDYVENPDKTDGGEWVTAFECDPLTVSAEFQFSKSAYAALTGRNQGSRDVIAYHLRQAFKPGEVDPATANRIGYELALKLTKGQHAFVCSTHVDKGHTHSHILINSTSLDCTRKFRNFKGSSFAIRRISDRLCLENGLSVIENPRPSRGSYGDWLPDKKPTGRDKLMVIIDDAIAANQDFDGFLAAMIAAGCEVKRGKHLAFKIPGAKKNTRLTSLGDDYSETAICERLSGERIVTPKAKTAEPPKSETANSDTAPANLLLTMQAKIQEGYANNVNLKDYVKTFIFLQENGVTSYDELAEKVAAASAAYNEMSAEVMAIEARLKEIAELQKQITAYSKTRSIYAKYKAAKFSQGFYAAHADDIILYKAATKHLNALGYGKGDRKSLPPIATLKQEYATLISEKKSLGSVKAAREKMIDWTRAKCNVAKLLADQVEEKKSHRHEAR
jgi:hypothetical protein